MHPASKGERDQSAAKCVKSSPPGLAAHQRDDAERADQREGVDRGVEQRRGKSFATARDEAEQRVTGVRDGRVGEQAADVGLRERDEISDDDRQGGQRGEHRRPTGDHRVPGGAALGRAEADQHDFSQHDERGDLRARGDERSGRNRRALIGVGRPEMERRGGDFEGEADQRHDDAGGEQRLDRSRRPVFVRSRRGRSCRDMP